MLHVEFPHNQLHDLRNRPQMKWDFWKIVHYAPFHVLVKVENICDSFLHCCTYGVYTSLLHSILLWQMIGVRTCWYCSLFLQKKDLSRQPDEDPFDSITDKIPERPVSVAEGASYSLVILAGLAVAGAAAYAVFKELIFEPKEWVPFC